LKIRIVFILTFIFSSFAFAQSIDVKLSADKSVYLIGDYIKITFEINYDKNSEIKLPSVKDSIKQLEYIKTNVPEKKEEKNRIHFRQTFTFSKYEPDTIDISGLYVLFKNRKAAEYKELKANSIRLIVKSYPVDNSKEIADIKKPVTIPFNWALLILILILASVLSFVIIYFWKKYKSQHQAAVQTKIIKLPNYQIALNSLAELEEKKLWQKGKIKEYHSEITEIIRTYFENEFNFKALEMTSFEIIQQLKSLDKAENIIDLVNEFFANADLVKFAKFQPMPSINEMMMKQAVEVVNQTKPTENKLREAQNV
jgi:hypothetical protein